MTCSHAPCTCDETALTREGKPYCGDACADAAQGHHPAGSVDGCPCGHPGCGQRSHAPDAPAASSPPTRARERKGG